METRFDPRIFIHPTAVVEDDVEIGPGTKIWMNVQVRQGVRIGAECVLSKDVFIDEGVQIGNRCKIQNGVSVYHGVELDDGVFLGPHCTTTNDLDPAAISHDGSLKSGSDWILGRTRIHYGARIGAHATIVCGNPMRNIGPWAMVAAGAVVTKDVEDFSLVAGNPARHLRYICPAGRDHDVYREEEGDYRKFCSTCAEQKKFAPLRNLYVPRR